MKGLAELTAENDAAVARAAGARILDERKHWMMGWERGLAFGRNGGRAAYRVKLRKILRERGVEALVREVTLRPRRKR